MDPSKGTGKSIYLAGYFSHTGAQIDKESSDYSRLAPLEISSSELAELQ